ncbi:MBL fold metallo-hydrolase [Cryobacterium sp. TMS1-20-1]|uniref:MBL fold metallo-hydrolase n=1 Tax=Cryobacterium sp. TMS1-20-1 TaxID=1259223 RepID=UPI00106D6140|nr:MBL fold metallo-hydrolase [Cryobacterium sp. TMS1-20-1]TFC74886.1 MBL fold metallo-hydrolase [Cryobacterium sp. TMS1-20-1]
MLPAELSDEPVCVVPKIEPIAPGIRLIRMPLPYEPFSVNCYLLGDDNDAVLIDTGIDDAMSTEIWDRLLKGPLASVDIKRIVATHWHNDHLGLAGHLAEKTGATVIITAGEFAAAHDLLNLPANERAESEIQFLAAHGADPQLAREWIATGFPHMSMISSLPKHVQTIADGDELYLAGRCFIVRILGGHSPATAVLIADDVVICGDQISSQMLPNVSVSGAAPGANPLHVYVRSLGRLRGIKADVLVLPGHEDVFTGLDAAIDRIIDRHEASLTRLLVAGSGAGQTATQLSAVLTREPPGPMWLGWVIGRAVAYARFAESLGLMRSEQRDAVTFFETVPGAGLTRDLLAEHRVAG